MERTLLNAGMYLLENLTSGMYTEPLSIYREYVQNAVDSIDLCKGHRGEDENLLVDISIDPRTKCITIRDNGIGINEKESETILSSIGNSLKRGKDLRGFRGIGRLGGIAFCEKAIFTTKADGESVESIQEWDCRSLRQILDVSDKSLSLNELFQKITKFHKSNSQPNKGGYFEVKLQGATSFRNSIFDIERVRSYLSQVAPVPFNHDTFSYAHEIDDFIMKNLNNYGRYKIQLNGEPIYKPYADKIRTTTKKGGNDYIEGIKYFKIESSQLTLAHGWYGLRRNLLGAINRGDSCAGIRIRVGNILLGDSHLLDKVFREDRFNGYMVGEIHIDSPDLIPNSRRDDFIDNEVKTKFYNGVEREIGLAISKEVRARSRNQSFTNKGVDETIADNIYLRPVNALNSELSAEDKRVFQYHPNEPPARDSILDICHECPNLSKVLLLINNIITPAIKHGH